MARSSAFAVSMGVCLDHIRWPYWKFKSAFRRAPVLSGPQVATADAGRGHRRPAHRAEPAQRRPLDRRPCARAAAVRGARAAVEGIDLLNGTLTVPSPKAADRQEGRLQAVVHPSARGWRPPCAPARRPPHRGHAAAVPRSAPTRCHGAARALTDAHDDGHLQPRHVGSREGSGGPDGSGSAEPVGNQWQPDWQPAEIS